MKNKLLVTIIIPHFRRLDFTLRAIESINRQKRISQKEIQIIVADEVWSQETEKKLKQARPNIVYVKNSNEEGPGGNRQSGIQLANGEYITFLDSDDQLKPDFIIRMTNTLRQDKNVSAVVCLSSLLFARDFPSVNRLKITLFIALRNLGLLFGYIFNRGRLYPSSFYFCQLSHMIFRGSVVSKLKFNYDYRRGGEDWDFVTSAQKFGPIKIVPSPLLLFYYSPGSSTFTPINIKLKWQSYLLLISRLPQKLKKGLFYRLFLLYIKQYGPKDT
jgi:GT2 family glycosyltransferase